jgi:hypothetical protein
MPRHSGFDCYAVFKNDPRFTNTHFIFLSTTASVKEIPAGSTFMRKQFAMKDYVAMLSQHIRPPSKSGSSGDRIYEYTSYHRHDTHRLSLQPSMSLFSSGDEFTALKLI